MSLAGSSRAALVMDLGLSSLKLRHGERGLELPIRRGPDGKVLPDCREEVRQSIRRFIEDGQPLKLTRSLRTRKGRRALCGIPSRGVSLRSLELPAASRDETRSLLTFQLEREFPLPLEELAFGYRSSTELNGAAPPRGGRTQEVLVAALRRGALEEYASMFAECGLSVSFALGSLAASQVCSLGAGHASVLDVGRTHSELVDVVDGRPRSVRCLSWSGETVTAAIAKNLGVHRDRAEELKLNPAAGALPETSAGSAWGSLDVTRHARAVDAAVQELTRQLQECWRSETTGNGAGVPSELILVGGGSRLPRLPDLLERGLGGAVRCRRAEVSPDVAASAVTAGLERQSRATKRGAVLRLEVARPTAERSTGRSGRLALAGWLVAVVVLVLASTGLRFAPPLLGEADLDNRIATRQAQLAAQPAVDLELSFLKMVKSNQTPYLEVLAAVAGAAPQGCFISEVTMSRRGDALLRGRIGGAAQLEEFRKKLSLSGWFERVVVQERTPQEKHMDFFLLTEFRGETTASPPASKPDEASKVDESAKPAEASKPSSPAASKPSGSEATAPAAESPPKAAAGNEDLATSGEEPAPGEGSHREEAKGANGSLEPAAPVSTETPGDASKSPVRQEAGPAEADTAATNATTETTGDPSGTSPDETETTPSTNPQ